MSHLADQLKNYYHEIGNKIVFKNKYTLNSLALEMWQRLEYRGIDASSLSRIINGKRLFTVKQLEAFCKILKIRKQNRDSLFLALEEDYLSRHGLNFYHPLSSRADIIDLLSFQVNKVHYAREHGLLQLVMDWSDELAGQIRMYESREKNTLYKRKLFSLLANVLFEKGYAAGSRLLPEDNMKMIAPLVQEQLQIAEILNSSELASKAYIIQAFAYYALGRYSYAREYRRFYLKSLAITEKAFKSGLISDRLALIYWRYVALNATYLSDIFIFQRAEKEIEKIVKRYNNDFTFSYIIWALDGLARGQAYFGDSKKALNTILESKSLEQRISWQDPLREAATIRNELEILEQLRIKDPSYIKQRLQRGLLLSSEYGFYRYKKYFENYLRGT